MGKSETEHERINTIIQALKLASREEYLENLPSFAIKGKGALGVPVPEIRKIAKLTGKSRSIATGLWATGIYEAMILATMVFPPETLTLEDAGSMVKDIESWDLCDHFTGNLVCNSPIAMQAVRSWHSRDEEYVRRSAFSIIAQIDHRKLYNESNAMFFLDCIKAAPDDGRNFVKKAVCWALREIGKSCRENHELAMDAAVELAGTNSKAAGWISRTAVRELNSRKVLEHVEKKPCYGNGSLIAPI